MLPTSQGSLRLFRLFGINIYVHWSWFILFIWRFQMMQGTYRKPIFVVAEILALFLIVLLHELGHSLACRQTGGKSDQIVLMFFGGVAYVQPPERPGAQLWSIAAGPLVNVVLLPLLWGLNWWIQSPDGPSVSGDVARLVYYVAIINTALLIFNMFPAYPLDGGQILRSLLWFWLGRGKSLLVASVVGFVGVALLGLYALSQQSFYMGLITLFIGQACWQGWKRGRAMMAIDSMPTRREFTCPSCRAHPPAGALWVCGRCGQNFDMFGTQGICPNCRTHYADARCGNCGQWATFEEWSHTRPML